MKEGSLSSEKVVPENGWPIVAQVEVIYDISKSITISLSGNLPPHVLEQVPPGNFEDGKGSINHETNDVMTAIFQGYLHGVNEPLRWKLASVESIFATVPAKINSKI